MSLLDMSLGGDGGKGRGLLVPGVLTEGDGHQLDNQTGVGRLDSGSDSGRSESRASPFPERVRSLGRELDKLLLAEKEKKKLSAAVHKAILDIRGRYEESVGDGDGEGYREERGATNPEGRGED